LKELRKYQQSAINSIKASLEKGEDKMLLCMATGLGKTFTAVKAIEQLGFQKALWITHRDTLTTQSALAFIRDKFDDSLADHVESVGYTNYIRNGGIFAGGAFKMGLVKADVFQPYGNVTISSTQTIHKKINQLPSDHFDFIIVDECHWGNALTKKTLDHFTAPRCGLSATPYSKDGVLLSSLFNEIVYDYNIKDGIKDGYLCELDGIRIKTNLSLDNVHTIGGEFNQRELADEVNCYARNKLCVDSYIKYANGLQGIFFCVDIQHCLDLLEVFLEAGINAKAVSSDESRTGNTFETIKTFKKGKIDVLINVEILTTGFDYCDIGFIGMARPTKSIVLFLQSVGRGTRLKSPEFVGKNGQKCLILDFIDNTSKHSLINTFTLDRGLEPDERTYITSTTREKLIEARRVRVEGKHNKDERIQLFPVLTPKFKTTIKSDEMASEAQIKWLRDLNYPVDEVVYTKENAREILGSLPASRTQIAELKSLNVDISAPITRGQASYTAWIIKNKKLKWNK
jgi:superfamily II DNA or RNA helicase